MHVSTTYWAYFESQSSKILKKETRCYIVINNCTLENSGVSYTTSPRLKHKIDRWVNIAFVLRNSRL